MPCGGEVGWGRAECRAGGKDNTKQGLFGARMAWEMEQRLFGQNQYWPFLQLLVSRRVGFTTENNAIRSPHVLDLYPAWASLSPLELLKNLWGFSVVPKQSPGSTLVLRNLWCCAWWPQGVTVGSHQELLEGLGWWWPQRPWSQGAENIPSLGLHLAVGEPHFLSLRLISQGPSSWCQTHPWVGSLGVCVHTFQYLDRLLSSPWSQETSPFHKIFIFPICLTRAPDTTQPLPLCRFPTCTPFCLKWHGPFLNIWYLMNLYYVPELSRTLPCNISFTSFTEQPYEVPILQMRR